jgi:hypothetical protein
MQLIREYGVYVTFAIVLAWLIVVQVHKRRHTLIPKWLGVTYVVAIWVVALTYFTSVALHDYAHRF